MRAQGLSEWTIAGTTKAATRVFKYARRRLNWHGSNPVEQLENGERPKTGSTERRRIFRGDELTQTLAAAHEPYRTLFALASVTGARLSECLGLVWGDVALKDLDAAEVAFSFQVDRHGQRQPLKTEASRRTVEMPRQLAAMLAQHKLASADTRPEGFVFATRTGRAISQRNTIRALRGAQTRAADDHGRPTFPILHARDERGRAVPVAHGAVPSFHSFRHSAASEAISAGDSAEEVSWQLGHKSSVVTRAVYTQEIKSAERTARRRARMEDRYGKMLESADRTSEGTDMAGEEVKVVGFSRGGDRTK
jgi:integrase